MSDDILKQITKSIVDGDSTLTITLTREALKNGLEPLIIIDKGLVVGMDIVGEKFSQGEYFLPHLVIAAKAMEGSMEVLDPVLLDRQETRRGKGICVIGTVQGDIHEIGKSLVGTMLSANGFQVHDLGVDVSSDQFIEKIKETGANLLALSALLTTTMVHQGNVIDALKKEGLRDKVMVMVGGAPANSIWAEEIGADGYGEDAAGAVRLAKQLVA
jgi:corrinoid protein of di/trimethylamine methyltransferase